MFSERERDGYFFGGLTTKDLTQGKMDMGKVDERVTSSSLKNSQKDTRQS